MITAVLDANVIVSGFPSRRGAPAELISRWLDKEFRIVISEHILRGVDGAWEHPWFRDCFSQHEVERAVSVLRTQAIMVMPASGIRGVAQDEEDDLVLATAVSGRVEYLVTGDRRLRAIDRYGNVTIRTPREFVLILDQASRALP